MVVTRKRTENGEIISFAGKQGFSPKLKFSAKHSLVLNEKKLAKRFHANPEGLCERLWVVENKKLTEDPRKKTKRAKQNSSSR